jgi:hypothetical protein
MLKVSVSLTCVCLLSSVSGRNKIVALQASTKLLLFTTLTKIEIVKLRQHLKI